MKSCDTGINAVDEREYNELLTHPVLMHTVAIYHFHHPIVDVHVHQYRHTPLSVHSQILQVKDDLEQINLVAHRVFGEDVRSPACLLHVSLMRRSTFIVHPEYSSDSFLDKYE